VFQTRCRPAIFARAVGLAANQLLASLGADGCAKQWSLDTPIASLPSPAASFTMPHVSHLGVVRAHGAHPSTAVRGRCSCRVSGGASQLRCFRGARLGAAGHRAFLRAFRA